MKILHICVTGPYTDDFNYQENMLTKYQVNAGYDVYIIASQWEWGKGGKIQRHNGNFKYKNKDAVSVIRLPILCEKDVLYRYKKFVGFYDAIEKVQPDIIFVHNLQFFDVSKIVKYAKKHKVKIYVDNHADFSNSARSRVAVLFYKIVWRHMAKIIEPYTTKFYGVLPARVDFLKDIYKLPDEKCELLVMGADDDKVAEAKQPGIRESIREKYGITDDDFLIMTGGKIDPWKTQTLLLMEAVAKIKNPKVKLIVFGSITPDLKEQVYERCLEDKVQYIGWINSDESYKYFEAADLVVFPGRHSVFWEQVAGMGIPMMCKYWEGTTHIDCGGNVKFIMKDTAEEIKKIIVCIVDNNAVYNEMLHAARGAKSKEFLYSNIAQKAIENTM